MLPSKFPPPLLEIVKESLAEEPTRTDPKEIDEVERLSCGGGGGWYPNPCKLTEAEPPLLLMFRVAL
jgi:hypothetical protein